MSGGPDRITVTEHRDTQAVQVWIGPQRPVARRLVIGRAVLSYDDGHDICAVGVFTARLAEVHLE